MTPELELKIRDLAAVARPTEQRLRDIIDGWDDLFRRCCITPAQEDAEFDAIMRVRLSLGIVSIVAE